MSYRQRLCDICHSEFSEVSNERLSSKASNQFTPLHLSSASFRHAVESRCQICCTIWKSLPPELQEAYLERPLEVFISMSYRVYTDVGNHWPQIDVRHYVRMEEDAHHLSLQIFPYEGLLQ